MALFILIFVLLLNLLSEINFKKELSLVLNFFKKGTFILESI